MGFVSVILIGFGCFLAGVFIGAFLIAALAASASDDWERDG
jgi:multisubunit Na+/H+ antiporter MnhB subunit